MGHTHKTTRQASGARGRAGPPGGHHHHHPRASQPARASPRARAADLLAKDGLQALGVELLLLLPLRGRHSLGCAAQRSSGSDAAQSLPVRGGNEGRKRGHRSGGGGAERGAGTHTHSRRVGGELALRAHSKMCRSGVSSEPIEVRGGRSLRAFQATTTRHRGYPWGWHSNSAVPGRGAHGRRARVCARRGEAAPRRFWRCVFGVELS